MRVLSEKVKGKNAKIAVNHLICKPIGAYKYSSNMDFEMSLTRNSSVIVLQEGNQQMGPVSPKLECLQFYL
jgi:hypothetical protein